MKSVFVAVSFLLALVCGAKPASAQFALVKPDLKVVDSFVIGNTAYVRVQNIGFATAPSTVMGLVVDGVLRRLVYVPSIASGSWNAVWIAVSNPVGFPNRLSVITVDYYDRISERLENNNSTWFDFRIQ